MVDRDRQDLVQVEDNVLIEVISPNGRRVASSHFTVGRQEIAAAYRHVMIEYNPVPGLTHLLQNYPILSIRRLGCHLN